MSTRVIDFTPDFVAHLGGLGLRLAIHGPTEIHVDTVFEPPVSLGGVRFHGAPAAVGAFTYICPGTVFANATIGRYCSVAEDVRIGATQHPAAHLTTSPIGYLDDCFGFESHLADQRPGWRRALPTLDYDLRPATTIGNDVWIGTGVYIRDGITIGDGAILGAHAVVTRDVPPYAIMGGSPARVIRYRFPDATIQRLRKVAWWRCNLLDQPGLDHADIDRSLDQLEERLAAGTIEVYSPAPINLIDEYDRYQQIKAFLARRSA